MTTILSTDLVVRVPREEEIEAICEMLHACDLADCGMPDSPLDQLRGEWREAAFCPETDARIVVAPGGRIVGYAAVRQRKQVHSHFEVRVHPAYRGQGIGMYLLEFVEKRAREFVSLVQPELRVTAQTWCHSGNSSGTRLLESAGYTCTRHTWAMAIDLPETPAHPAWAEGVTLRPFVPERDARAVFEATEESFTDHWGYLPGTFEDWYQRHIINAEDFDPALWFIAIHGDEIAGVSLCGYYLDAGLVNILGVRRPWRRLGLGLALLRHSFNEFYRRGTHKVVLGVDAQSLTGATRLYQRAGMYIELSYDQYEKELRAGLDLSTQSLANEEKR